jgi:23S rRNA (uracil1939-C5)-methyltransferase
MQSNPLQQSVLYNHVLLCTEDSIINQRQQLYQQQQQLLNRERHLNDHDDSDAYNDSHGHDKLSIYHDQQPVTVWDLYCGVGTIGMYLSKSKFIKQVIAIEESESAIQDANLNAKLNNITNIRFLCGKVEDFIFSNLNHSNDNHVSNTTATITTKEIASRASASILKRRTSSSLASPSSSLPTMQSQDIIIINPPRRGCHPDLLTKISQSSVRTLIYISCNPQSLVRDLKTLVTPGRDFSVRSIIPVDMFPHTVHVETIVLLERTVSMIKGV